MATFPLARRPQESYKDRPRSFGSPRSGGKRKHAGCDPYAAPQYSITGRSNRSPISRQKRFELLKVMTNGLRQFIKFLQQLDRMLELDRK